MEKMMKKIIPILALAAICIAPACAKRRAANASEMPDSYDEVETVIPVDKEKTNAKKAVSDDPYDKEKLRPQNDRSFGQKLFGLNRFQQIAPFSVFAKSSVGKLHLKKNGSLIHRAGTDIGGFYCYYDTSAYAVQFAQQARSVLVSAVEQYLSDFDNKKLDKNAKKKDTESVYGTAEAYEEYGIALANLNHAARPIVTFGYEFINGNPYFMIYAKKAKDIKYVHRSNDDSNADKTIPQRYYFTKAQAKTLATFLSDSNIESLRKETNYDEVSEDDFDSYDNSGAANGE